jgi:hypothetical protein
MFRDYASCAGQARCAAEARHLSGVCCYGDEVVAVVTVLLDHASELAGWLGRWGGTVRKGGRP